jgi:hypothetical protein
VILNKTCSDNPKSLVQKNRSHFAVTWHKRSRWR